MCIKSNKYKGFLFLSRAISWRLILATPLEIPMKMLPKYKFSVSLVFSFIFFPFHTVASQPLQYYYPRTIFSYFLDRKSSHKDAVGNILNTILYRCVGVFYSRIFFFSFIHPLSCFLLYFHSCPLHDLGIVLTSSFMWIGKLFFPVVVSF